MTWLILQMLVCLAAAFGLGLLVGWWVRGLGVEDRRRREGGEWERRVADYKQRLEASQADALTAADHLAACEARSAELARRLDACLAATDEPATAPPPTGEPEAPTAPPADPERWVVTAAEPPESEDT